MTNSLNATLTDNLTSPLHHVIQLELPDTIFLVIFCVIDIVALVGNTLTIATICRRLTLKSMYYVLLLNLALSDLIFSLMAPIHVHWMLSQSSWFLGDFGCKLYYFLFRALYAFSVLVLVTITIERFLASRFPLIIKGKHPRVSLIVVTLWVSSFACTSPNIYVHEQVEDNGFYQCYQVNWPSTESYKSYHAFIYLVLYVIPLATMIVMYALIFKTLRKPPPSDSAKRSRVFLIRRRKAKMLFILVVAFFLFWSPYTFLEAAWVINSPLWKPPTSYFTALQFSMLPVFTSAGINPLLYCFLSQEFRNGLRKLCVNSRDFVPDSSIRASNMRHVYCKTTSRSLTITSDLRVKRMITRTHEETAI